MTRTMGNALDSMRKFIGDKIFITQSDGEGGDTCQRTGMFMFGVYFVETRHDWPFRFKMWVGELNEKPGLLIRHPMAKGPNRWTSDPKRTSRDQHNSFIIGAGAQGFKKQVFLIMLRHIFRLGFYQNTYKNWVYKGDKDYGFKIPDWSLPILSEHWGIYYRALCMYFMYPVLLVSDLQLLGSTLIMMYRAAKDPEYTTDDLNHQMMLGQAQKRMPTVFSELARYIYMKFRVLAGPEDKYDNHSWHIKNKASYGDDWNGPFSAIAYYFRPESKAPPMDELYFFVSKELNSFSLLRTLLLVFGNSILIGAWGWWIFQ